jgi:hypothetical protein
MLVRVQSMEGKDFFINTDFVFRMESRTDNSTAVFMSEITPDLPANLPKFLTIKGPLFDVAKKLGAKMDL